MGWFDKLSVALTGLQSRRFLLPGFRPAKRDSTLGLLMGPFQGQVSSSIGNGTKEGKSLCLGWFSLGTSYMRGGLHNPEEQKLEARGRVAQI